MSNEIGKYIFDLNHLRKDIVTKRVVELNMSMDQAVEEIGISKSTLSRVENFKMIDIDSFAKIVGWLNENPSKYFKTISGAPLKHITNISDTNLSARAKGVLKSEDIITLTDLRTADLSKMHKWRNCGPMTVREITNFLNQLSTLNVTPP